MELEIETSRQFTSWLADSGNSLVFTTYQAGKLFTLGTTEAGELSVFERSLDRCMGLAIDGNTLYVSSLYQIWRYENLMAAGENHQGFDACYSPQMSWVTGDLDVHDMAIDEDGELLFVNTLFGCLSKPSNADSFVPVWKPPFLSRLAAEDRCHLNGLAMEDGRAAFVTSVSRTDVVDGWRDNRSDGGCVTDVRSNEIVASGLSMPHSPRVYDGKLWLLDSGNGYFGFVDLKTGAFEKVAFCPGYARGMAFWGNYAVIGLSLPRDDNKTFKGLALEGELERHGVDPRCGLIVIDISSGDIVHWCRINGVVKELYDIGILPRVKRPSLIGFKTDEIRRMIKIGQP